MARMCEVEQLLVIDVRKFIAGWVKGYAERRVKVSSLGEG